MPDRVGDELAGEQLGQLDLTAVTALSESRLDESAGTTRSVEIIGEVEPEDRRTLTRRRESDTDAPPGLRATEAGSSRSP